MGASATSIGGLSSVTSTTFVGALTGNASTATSATSATTATNATNIAITDTTTTAGTYYPVFVSATTGNVPARTDSSTFTYNPHTNTLTVGTVSGALTGNASTATTAGAWTTGRTITIGSTGKTVDGSGNVSWTLAEIGAYANTNPSGYTTNTGTVTSVATAGTVSGITLTGGTITGAGTITLGGSISGLTNSNLSGTAGITNANLANSSVTIGSTTISLGSSATTIAGLVSVTSTGFTGALTGNASTATNSSQLNGISSTQIFNNMGQIHSTRTSFDAATPSYDFGFRYIQGTTNGPATGGGSQFYSWYTGLGSDYPATGAGSYGMYVAIPRFGTTPYMSIRYNEGNVLGSWIKIAAGYADTAGAVDFNALTNKASGTGTYTTSGDFRAPIFYDTDNTAYNVNPAATSTLQTLAVTSACSALIFYNYGSTSYYVNPGSTSRLLSLDMVGAISSQSTVTATSFVESANSAYYFDGGNTGDSIRTAGNIVAYYSDERLKDKKGNIENALEKLLTLNGFYYEPNERAQELGYKKKLEIGVSAQEVEAVLPEIVNDAPIGYGYKTLDYSKLVPLLIEAIKEQQKQIDELKRIK